ncbi:MAG: hypothetical protein ACOCVR_04960 [Myxococcota bacterium]
MIAALDPAAGTRNRNARRLVEARARESARAPSLTAVEVVELETLEERPRQEEGVDCEVVLDGALVAAASEMLRSQRIEAAGTISEDLASRGVDPTVCAFLEDDLREAADALADAEAYFQETVEALAGARPSPGVLMERAADADVLERVDHLHQVLFNMRRRLVQVAAGIRHAERPRR